MGIRLQRFPEYALDLHIYSGVVAADELIRHFETLDTRDASRWVHWFDAAVDLSGLEVADLPELKRTIAAKQKELFGDKPPASAVVCGSSGNEQFFRFWRGYTETGGEHPSQPVMFCSLGAVCEWLELSEAARRAVLAAVDARKAPESGWAFKAGEPPSGPVQPAA